ncbi:MAG: GntR family transcriptional regulator [Advenella sp.]
MSSTEIAYQGVRLDILNQVYRPGDRIKEVAVARKYGVSRTPLRQAFGRLISEGWLENIPNQGVRVTKWSVADLEHIFDIRVRLEPYLTRCAVGRLDTTQLQALKGYADDIARYSNTAGEVAIQKRTQANHLFHNTLLTASGNPRAVAILNNLVELPLVIWTFRQFTPQETNRSNDHHYEIVQAAGARDGCWAESVMLSHILAAKNTVISRLTSQAESAGR